MTGLATGRDYLPLSDEQNERVLQAVDGLSPAQLTWVSGYLAGMAGAANAAGTAPAAPAADTGLALTILYGSQTGNGEAIAETLAGQARAAGHAPRLRSLADYRTAELKREKLAIFVVSTHGEGDPPDDAELFHEFLLSGRAPELPALGFAVLALGDSSYANFCQTGREFDARLAELGARRLHPLVECDVDYDAAAQAWTEAVLETLPAPAAGVEPGPRLRAVPTPAAYDRKRPFPAEVLATQRITGRDSSKDVYHVELSLEGSGLGYEPGDALAVVAENPPELVAEIIALLGATGDEPVTVADTELPLADALTARLEITRPSTGFLEAWAGFSRAPELAQLLGETPKQELAAFLAGHQVVDVMHAFPAAVDAAAFAASLRPAVPRSYSIASSLAANPDEVHLTVAAVRYEAFGRPHRGAASTFLGERIEVGDRVPVYVEPNKRFRLPADDVPVIMIGPGTGVAPFRAFVEERAVRGARGKTWLFFGDRNFSSDFLYQLEWLRHLREGNLTRMDVAFSRDTKSKVYVQHRMLEHGAEIHRWIEEGASVYVCGDAKRMAGDVEAALARILAEHGGRDADAAAEALTGLRRAGRYLRDVY